MADSGLLFVIGGLEYPAPTLRTFTMAERRVMYDLSGITEEDFTREEGETEEERADRVDKVTRHAGYMESLMHVAYARGNPELTRAQVQKVIDGTNYQEAIAKWGEAQADDADPPTSESTTSPEKPLPTDSDSSTTSSGLPSATASGPPDRTHESIGTGESETQAASGRSLSAV